MRAEMIGSSGRLLAASLFIAALAPSASAQQGATENSVLVDAFNASDGRSALFVMTGKDEATLGKFAGVGIRYEKSGANYVYNGTYGTIGAVFASADDWSKFVKLWSLARAKSARHEDSDGFYSNGGQAVLGVGTTQRGEISFSLATEGEGGAGTRPDIRIFFLQPKDFPALDRDIRQISAYFAK